MIRIWADVWRRHRLAAAAFVLASALTLLFAARFVASLVYWSAHHEEPIAGWMTVGYVARSWGVPPRRIDEIAGLPPPDGRPLTLDEIAAARGVPVETVVVAVRKAVGDLRAEAGESPP